MNETHRSGAEIRTIIIFYLYNANMFKFFFLVLPELELCVWLFESNATYFWVKKQAV